MTAPTPDNEDARLAALRHLQLLDTAPEEAFDDLAALAAQICGVPIAAVSMVDERRQWFKSMLGLAVTETSRDAAFCAHTILQTDLLIVPDACADQRFADNPLVTGDPHIRFYAGAPLITSDGHALGSLCVIDRVPRQLTPEQKTALQMLAHQVGSQIELKQRAQEQERIQAKLRQSEARLREAQAVAHIGSWEFDVVTGEIIWSEELFHLFERDFQEGAPSLEEVRAYYHPEDVPTVMAIVQQAIEDGLPYEMDIRIRRRDGTIRWVQTMGQGTRDAEGKVSRLIGIAMDISQRKEMELALEKQRQFQDGLLESLQEGIIACDAQGQLTLLNQTMRQFHDLSHQEIPLEQWPEKFSLFQADGITPLAVQDFPLFRALQGEKVLGTELVASTDHGARTLSVNGQAIYDTMGQKLGAVVAIHDITERRLAEQELSRLAAIVESAEDAITVSTLEGTLVIWNKGAERLYGYSAAEMVGNHVSAMSVLGESSPVPRVVKRLLNGEAVESVTATRFHKNGTRIEVSLLFSPLRDESGVLRGISCIARDITAHKRMEQELRESQLFIQNVADHSTSMIYVFDLDTRSNVYANRDLAEFWGYSPAQILEMGDALVSQVVHPDDMPYMLAHFEDFASVPDGQLVEFETRCRAADGGWRWLWVREVVFKRHEGGTARQIMGTAHDITERKALEEERRASHSALAASAARLAEAQRLAKVGNWEYDLTTGKITWSAELFRLFGLDPVASGEPDYQSAVALYHPEDAPKLDALVMRAAQEGIGYALDLRGMPSAAPGVPMKWYHTVGTAVKDENGKIVRLMGTLADITERKEAEERITDYNIILEFQKQQLELANNELEMLATTDGLTGLKNHRTFQERLLEEVGRASRYQTPLSVILLDVDHFKQYNDTFGHPEGDIVLRTVARILERSARDTDFVARYGGEEFVLILPQTDSGGAAVIAERMRRAVEEGSWHKRAITASFGVATLGLGTDGSDLVSCADAALYRAKAGGRNRVAPHEAAELERALAR